MRTAVSVGLFLLVTACNGAPPAVRPADSRLTPEEFARAIAAAMPSGDVSVLTVEGREYVGWAGVEVQTGPGSPERVTLNVGASYRTDRRRVITGYITIPEATALSLASEGWDLSTDDPAFVDPPNGFSGDVYGRVTRAELRADPDGVYVATYTMVEPDGDVVVITAAGRLRGACAHIDADDTVTTIADVSTVARCEQVLGAL